MTTSKATDDLAHELELVKLTREERRRLHAAAAKRAARLGGRIGQIFRRNLGDDAPKERR